MIPETVKIGSVEYAVIREGVIDSEPDLLGRLNVRRGCIKLRKDLSPAQAPQTLLHEILHCIEWHCGMQHGETVVQILTDVIQRNLAVFAGTTQLPDVVDIVGLQFAVVQVDALKDACGDEDESAAVDFNPSQCCLRVVAGTLQYMMSALVAAVCVCASGMMSLGLSEKEARRVGRLVHQVLRDNPSLWESQIPAERPSAKRRRHKPDAPKAA